MDEIILDGVIGGWEIDSRDVISQLNQCSGDVTVKINSIGGSVWHGISIFNAFKEYNKGKINVIITGIAASIASYIALAGDNIKAYDNATYMIHNASIYTFGDHRELRKSADIAENCTKLISNAYISRTSMSDKVIRKLMDEETFYFGSQMLEAGFVDEIISTESSLDEAQAKAIAIEGLKACNNAIQENENNLSLEAVAKLLPVEEVLIKEEIILEVVDLSAQQQRRRSLQILENGVKL